MSDQHNASLARFKPQRKNANKHTARGGTVADYFAGSGTTLVACETTGRVGYAMELEPAYCAVILERLTGLGLQARRVTDD